ncbi:hypothetical protein M885DRAFT_591874 [Pelagophyceae sp. CCMP2097]|nr:hypothetical protein M885DRAFT_591874 [Pelagophyceae sp. CCMP2097]
MPLKRPAPRATRATATGGAAATGGVAATTATAGAGAATSGGATATTAAAPGAATTAGATGAATSGAGEGRLPGSGLATVGGLTGPQAHLLTSQCAAASCDLFRLRQGRPQGGDGIGDDGAYDRSRGSTSTSTKSTYQSAWGYRWASFHKEIKLDPSSAYGKMGSDEFLAQLVGPAPSYELNVGLIERFLYACWDDWKTKTPSTSVYRLTAPTCDTLCKALLWKALGTLALWTILNGGKSNQSGNLEYMASFMHMNPLLCAVGAGGLLKLFRFCCLDEPLEVYDDLSAGKFYVGLFTTFVMRSDESKSKAMNYQRLYDGFVSLSSSTGIDLRKPTHFCRVNAVQTLNNSGLDGDLAQRAVRRVSDSTSESYLDGPPASTTAYLAGGPECGNLRSFHSPQTQAMGSAEVLAVIDILVPRLLANAKAIQAAFDLAAHGQRKDTKEQRLHTLLGSSKAAVFQVKAALVQAASRPRGADAQIVQNSDVVARLFLGNPVFKLPAFISPEFDALIAVVRSFEEAHLTNPCAQFGPLLATVGEAVQMSVQPLYGQLVQTHHLVERFAFGAPALALGRLAARPLPPLALQPAVREVTPGFRRMTRDMLSLYGLRPVRPLSDLLGMDDFWLFWTGPLQDGSPCLAELERVPGVPWRSSVAVPDQGLRNALKTKMSKIRLIVGMVEEEVESPAHQGLAGALQAVYALIPPSTAKFSMGGPAQGAPNKSGCSRLRNFRVSKAPPEWASRRPTVTVASQGPHAASIQELLRCPVKHTVERY